ncbi:hypothetical protein BDQ94DRAFT_149445 [Aspergillus welwitschiae]|uniref:Uncharacterized protein n=1 Tax=Aspergillus welwitschiae TaxID=1341132 RepID=A0A3F3PT07_9EURO|nr:hypothetical protein BDQ94DRAFT_149445 [Aspergillus welwitschiae]RDH30044.1 hypothetical protein BDQ94DRAFT_149445 [Aspergillus welwitschiae]
MMMLMLMLMLLLLLLLMMMKQIIPTGLTEDSIPGPNRDQSGNMTGGFATELIWEFLAVPPQSAAVLAEGGSFATDPIKGQTGNSPLQSLQTKMIVRKLGNTIDVYVCMVVKSFPRSIDFDK